MVSAVSPAVVPSLALSLSVSRSLTHSLTRSLTHSLTHSLNPHTHSLTHPVGVLGRHGVRPDVLHVGDEQVAVLGPADGRGVDVAHDEAEEVAAGTALINKQQ